MDRREGPEVVEAAEDLPRRVLGEDAGEFVVDTGGADSLEVGDVALE